MADDNTDSWMGFAKRSRDDGGLGLQPHQAAGLVGNLQNESGSSVPAWGPTGDNGSAWGTAQWRGDRLDNLKSYAADNGLDHRTVEAQQAFMRHEFDTTENSSYKALQAAQTPEAAATAVNTQYERSADRSGNRERAARAIMDGPTAIDAAMGRTRPSSGAAPRTGSQAMSYAAPDPNATQPALNPQQPQGALTAGGQPVEQDNWGKFAQMLKDMAPGIAQDPAHAQVLEAAANATRPKPVAPGTWSVTNLPDGTPARVHSSTGTIIGLDGKLVTGDHAKETAWVHLGKDASGVDRWGPRPTDEQLAAQAAAPPPSAYFGDESKADGPDFYKTVDPVHQKIIDGWHAGTGMLPSPRDMDKPDMQKLMATAVKAYPDTDFTNLPARQRLAKTLTDSSPASNGGIITNANAAAGILNDIANQHIALHNGGDFLGSTTLGNAKNSMIITSGDRSDIMKHIAGNADDASGEITKVLTGGPGGVEERKTRSLRLGDTSYTPKQAAGALEGELNDLAAKHKETVDKFRQQMGQSYLDRFPVIEKNFKDHEANIRSKIDTLRSAGSDAATKPTTGTFQDVPWRIIK